MFMEIFSVFQVGTVSADGQASATASADTVMTEDIVMTSIDFVIGVYVLYTIIYHVKSIGRVFDQEAIKTTGTRSCLFF